VTVKNFLQKTVKSYPHHEGSFSIQTGNQALTLLIYNYNSINKHF